LISGVFFAFAWNDGVPAFSLFFAFIPLLFLSKLKSIHYTKFFNLALLSFLCYHIGTVWWLSISSIPGFLVIILLNSFFMAVVLLLSFLTYKKFGNAMGLLSFPMYWLSFEFIHYRWEFSWPFMNLGNWLGQMPKLIQWYEYTGVLGGTFWILSVNIAIFLFIKLLISKKIKTSILAFALSLLIIIIPILISQGIYNSYQEKGLNLKMKIIQPNINPYTEKYNKQLFNTTSSTIDTSLTSDTKTENTSEMVNESITETVNESVVETETIVENNVSENTTETDQTTQTESEDGPKG